MGGTSTKLSRRKNEALVSKDSAADAKSQASLKKRLALSADAQAREADDAVVEISLDDAVSIPAKAMPAPTSTTTKAKKAQNSASQASAVVDPALRDSDDEGDDVEVGERGDTSFKQKDLVALAFAGDNVVEVCATLLCTTSLRTNPISLGIQRPEATGDRSGSPKGDRYYACWMGKPRC